MASANGDEEYESDPEEAKLSLAMRRRVASDDEEDEEGGDEVPHRVNVRASDEEFDNQGVPEDYDEETDEEEEEFRDREGANVEIVNDVRGVGRELLDREVADGLHAVENQVEGDEEKKEHEPFAVPTAGAFYMHDDRFRDNAAGRHRRALGAQKIWESRDERRWGHDKFEELTSQDSNYSESRRNSKEHHRGRGRNRGAGRGYIRGNRSKMPEDNSNQAPVPTIVRGRGPRRYDLVYKRRSEVPDGQNKQHFRSEKNLEKVARSYSDKGPASSSSVAYEAVPAKKNMVASNLSSASPPFYPSGSSGKDLNVAPKMDVQSANTERIPQPFAMDENRVTTHANTMYRGKDVGESLGLSKLHLKDTIRKPSNNSNVPPSGSTSTSKGPQVRNQGRGQGYTGHMLSPSASHPDHASKVSGVQLIPSQQGPLVQNRKHSYSLGPAQPVSKQTGNGSQASSSPPGCASLKSFEGAEESQSESGNAKTDIVPIASSAVQGGALSPFMYNGGQIMGATGNMGVAHGDPNFPTFLPVMQFGAQHPGGIGVPAVGMAFPGYVQPQHGQASSEMTWLPVLAGAAGALGATYCPPYMLDGATYNSQLTGPPFAASSSNKEAIPNKALNEWNPAQKLEHTGEEFDHRENKPRRYSEMKFGQ